MSSRFVFGSVMLCAVCQAATLTSSSQANCYSEAPVVNQSNSAPVASSAARCAEMFSFSNSAANTSGMAAYGSLAVMGSAGDKDLQTSYQSSVSFSDTLHFYGPNLNGNGNFAVQFVVDVKGNLVPDSVLPFPTQSFSATFTGGLPPVAVSMSCSFACSLFAQSYLVTDDDPGGGPVTFSGGLTGSGSTFAGDSAESASLQIESINLLGVMDQPLTGLSYSTDSGAQYNIDATFIPEPGGYALLLLGAIMLGLLRRLAN